MSELLKLLEEADMIQRTTRDIFIEIVLNCTDINNKVDKLIGELHEANIFQRKLGNIIAEAIRLEKEKE